MKKCTICEKSCHHFLNNKAVCLRCDELLIDIEIECDEEPITLMPKRGGNVETDNKTQPRDFN